MSKKIPETLDEAVSLIIESIEPEELAKTRALTKKMDLEDMVTNVHHTMGRFYRNELNFWHPSSAGLRKSIWESLSLERQRVYDDHWQKYGQLHQGEDMHADDASSELLLAVLRVIRDF